MLARRPLAHGITVVVLTALVGCSGDPDPGQYAQVSGVVTQGGAPVSDAKVTFHSTVEGGGATKDSFSAQTDSSGKYMIAMVGKQPGIPPGMYKVTVAKLSMKGGMNLPPDFDQGQLEASGMAQNTLVKEYELPSTTKLSATLQQGKNEANFDLKGGK